jgi:hypothetical protein
MDRRDCSRPVRDTRRLVLMQAERTEVRSFTHKPTQVVALGFKRRVCASCGTDWPCPDGVRERCADRMASGQEWCDCSWHEAKDGGKS